MRSATAEPLVTGILILWSLGRNCFVLPAHLVEDGRTGLLSPVGDADALASNVIRLLRDQELAHAIARSAYEKSKTFHWEHVRNDWLKVYRSLEDNGLACQADDTQTGVVGVDKRRL